ncbi:hypothetical protein FNV43_RR00843 [Rhamnella rubrinervis]|uniref:CW-type domain-containing protein n=1 Tax=Rhamnella rubrinervis TaxID=2594499 RepID=A0A8K0HRE3_9ROSA|nr:hypothetical protein FNV43_RR00843 [Rhamnella rubrinervis]
MEENSELEEGEACYYKDDDENIDPDIDLSYIDEKIQHFLGHFQRDFEGLVSAENLGAKCGEYGSFLPTYERSPYIWPHPKTPQKNHITSRSPSNLPMEGASQNEKASSNAPPSVRPGTVSSSSQLSHNTRAPSGDFPLKQNSGLLSTQVTEKCSWKNESSNRARNPTDQRTLKFRIKMGSDNMAQKNAIYSGLGLDDSPSSSSGNSPDECGGVPPVSQESPSNIIQIMTSFPVPGEILISPLQHSMLGLIRKDKLHGASNPEHACKHVQEHSTLLAEKSFSMRANRKVLKEKKTKLRGRNERQTEMKHGIGCHFENDMTIPEKMTSKKEASEGKDFLSNDLNGVPKSDSACEAGDLLKVISQPSEVSREVNNNEVKGRLCVSELVKEESLESISGQDYCKNEKKNSRSGSVEKVWEHRAANSQKDATGNLSDDNKSKSNKISVSSKAYSDVSKCKEEVDLQRQSVGEKSTAHEQDKRNVPLKKEKPSFEGKNKSKEILANGKHAAILAKESLRIEMGASLEDKRNTTRGVSPCSSKMQKYKTNNNNKGKDKNRDPFRGKHLEQTNNKLDPRDRTLSGGPKDAYLEDVQVEQKVILDKPKESLSGKKVDNRSMSEASLKDAPNACPPIMENGLASQMVPAPVAPVVIEEDWVCCDSCQQWRLLPFGTKPEQLPEKWLCSMLNWLPGMNRCDISEEETTKALHALYQLPVSDHQNSLQNQANGSASGVTAVDFQHLGQNLQNINSNAIPNRGKKRHGSKEIPNSGSSNLFFISNPTKNHLHEPVKSKSLNDMNQLSLESNPVKKSSSQHLSKPCSLEMNISKQKENPVNGGDTRERGNKSKREAGQYACGTSKKPKTETIYNANIEQGKTGLGSIASLPRKVHEKDMQGKDMLQTSARKLDDQSQVSSDGGSLDVRTGNKRVTSMKKRKLKDWQDDQIHVDAFQISVHNDKAHMKEESSESGFRKEKKSRVSRTDEKESSSNSGYDKSKRKSREAHAVSSGCKIHQVDGMEENRSMDKDQQPRKLKKIVSQQPLDGVYFLKKDLGSGQVSVAATSSSSKVSSCHKIRGNVEEVKGSPVESVSSSPLRICNLDKVMPAVGDVSATEDAGNGSLPSVSKSKRYGAGDANVEISRFGVSRKEKVSCDSRPKSLKVSTLDQLDVDGKHEFSVKAKPSSEVGNAHSVSCDVGVVEHGRSPIHQYDMEHRYDEARVGKNQDAIFLHKSGNGSSLQPKDKGRSLASNLDRGKMKVADSVSEFSKNIKKYESEIEPNHHPSGPETTDVKDRLPKKCSIKSVKDEKNQIIRMDYAGQGSSGNGMIQIKQKDCDEADYKLGATNRNVSSQNTIQDSEGIALTVESRTGKPKVFSNSVNEGKNETRPFGFQTVPGSERAAIVRGLPVDVSGNVVPKIVENSGGTGNKSRVNRSLGHLSSDQQGARDVSSSSPLRNFSDLTASNTLKEAKELRDYADRLKSSGFAFESSEAYFQAALMFLHGAVLLEACGSQSGKHGEMSQMQVYSTTAKLCELCAHEYERRKEMAAAALAYKCMEVAYMRVVYCKHSSTNRDRHELQATLNMVPQPQGESPSSSASDVDNLNNPLTLEKATIPKGASHDGGNHVILAQNSPNFVRLLDFTQDVSFAMEASRKSQTAFAAAHLTMEEAQNKDCIVSLKSVIDFSFQDIEELIRLVKVAMEAINRSDFGELPKLKLVVLTLDQLHQLSWAKKLLESSGRQVRSSKDLLQFCSRHIHLAFCSKSDDSSAVGSLSSLCSSFWNSVQVGENGFIDMVAVVASSKC